MRNYDFQSLSPFEFESLSRDLLQKFLKLFLESFGEGKDGGIDLRCSKVQNIIIQAKRYKNFSSLFSNLKKEILKVEQLNPERYIITTSSSLSPKNKEKILKLFTPYIKDTEDIFGKEDINNLLSKFPEVEKDYYKLWLSSTYILNEIINSQVINQTNFFLEELKAKIETYVQNDSFHEALSILDSNKYVIISGDPGIGKTTLAEMLVFHLLGRGIDEFIFLSDSISEGFNLYNEKKSQVFLFDDFLGRNFLNQSLATNEERQILRFIQKIEKSYNKVLIFTTREYILNQAKLRYDLFDYDFSKCILDLSKYTTLVKAKILYNHLYANKIPFEYIKEIINQRYLMRIIKHQNYSPRIIASFSNSKLWKNHSAVDFPEALINLFDAPFLVWEHVYENQISSQSRVILDCLLLTTDKIEFNDLYQQVKTYQKRNKDNFDFKINGVIFKAGLRELEKSMIRITRTNKTTFIKYQNPSIQDFLVNYINKNNIIKKSLISSILYIKPTLDILTERGEINSEPKIELSHDELQYLEELIISKISELEFSPQVPPFYNPTKVDLEIKKLFYVINFFDLTRCKHLASLESNFEKIIYSEKITYFSIHEFVDLIEYFSNYIEYDVKKILLNISGSFWIYQDLEALTKLRALFPTDFKQFTIHHNEIYSEIILQIICDLSTINSNDIDTLRSNIENLKAIELDFDIQTQDEVLQLEKGIQELVIIEEHDRKTEEIYSAYFGNQSSHESISKSNYNIIETNNMSSIKTEDYLINSMFKSLK